MVNPSQAGVIFTADPITGDRSRMIIESVAGLGEALVSGQAEASRYVLNPVDGTILEQPDSSESGCLEDRILEELRTGAILAEADWGVPLDLEWAVDERSGELRWLQARPITALADSLDSHLSPETLITRCNIGEMMPGAVTPLTHCTFGRSLSTGMAMFYRSFGALSRKEPDPSFVESFEDQLFMNLSNMYTLARRVAGASVEATELSILGYVLPSHPVESNALGPIRILNGLRYMRILMSWKSGLRKIGKLAREFSFETEGRSARELHQAIVKAHHPVMDQAVAWHYVTSGFSGAMNAALAMTLSGGGTEVSDQARALITELLAGVENVESAAVLEGLEELANLVRGSEAESVLYSSSPDTAHAALLAHPSPAGEFYRSFMNRHGYRCIREAELREPEWALQPAHLIDSLKGLVSAPPRPRRTAGPVPVEELDIPEGVNLRVVKWITKQARRGVWVREKSKAHLILIIHQFKLAARAMAAALEAEGFLPDADLTYFLTLEELAQVLDGRGDGLIGRARRRRRRYPERQEIRFAEVSRGRPVPEDTPLPADGENLMGTPVSRGIVEGPVRVVKERKDAEELRSGEIMVAQFTDIGWTPFYGRVAGMITEIGGALSHGSVVGPGIRAASGGWAQRRLHDSADRHAGAD